jgi:hypothetical protein
MFVSEDLYDKARMGRLSLFKREGEGED